MNYLNYRLLEAMGGSYYGLVSVTVPSGGRDASVYVGFKA